MATQGGNLNHMGLDPVPKNLPLPMQTSTGAVIANAVSGQNEAMTSYEKNKLDSLQGSREKLILEIT